MRVFVYTIISINFFISASTNATDDVKSWTGRWFPEKPREKGTTSKDLEELFGSNEIKTSNNILTSDKNNIEKWNSNSMPSGRGGIIQNKTSNKEWSGNWFPQKSSNTFTVNTNNSQEVKATIGRQRVTSTQSWNGKWFPQTPSDEFDGKRVKPTDDSNGGRNNETWKGNWFPQNPFNISLAEKTKEEFDNKSWDGIWFPASPSNELLDLNRMPPSIPCDNGKDNIDIDYDPENRRHGHKYLCLDFKAKYEPNYSINPIQRKFAIPTAYKAPSYCLNETIVYEERLPTFGSHRYLSPKYGEFKYLPAQRWMHGLEKGAIVMLYHPCANQMQVEKLRTAVRACLYRHLISASTLLLPERPLALVAWGTSLEMSVVHLPAVVDFIKENAKHGPQAMNEDNKVYQAAFLFEAKLVTDESDSELCPNFNL